MKKFTLGYKKATFGHWISLDLTEGKLLEIWRKVFSVDRCMPLN